MPSKFLSLKLAFWIYLYTSLHSLKHIILIMNMIMMKTLRHYLEKRQRKSSREVLMMVYLHKRGEGIWNYSGRGDFVKTASTNLTSPRYMTRDCSTSDTILKMELFLGFLFWHWLWYCTLTVIVNHVEYVMNYGCLLNYQGVLSTNQIVSRDWELSKESIKSHQIAIIEGLKQ